MSRVGDLYTGTTTQDCEVAKHLAPQRVLVLASGLRQPIVATRWQVPDWAAFMNSERRRGVHHETDEVWTEIWKGAVLAGSRAVERSGLPVSMASARPISRAINLTSIEDGGVSFTESTDRLPSIRETSPHRG
jgi:hypothetical protein